MEQTSSHRVFDGEQQRYRHTSTILGCEMHFSLYLPPQAQRAPVPLLVWLSGLTCTDENFVTKAGAQQHAANHGMAILAPDTSPRGAGVADDPAGAYDFGLGAGFYVNATQAPYAQHYQMYDYVLDELPALLRAEFPMISGRMAIAGHSMGGHGALTLALGNPGRYCSVSAFAPICAPSRCPWGIKALTGYLGADRENWLRHDAERLVATATALPALIDQGDADEFLAEQLLPERLLQAADDAGFPIDYRVQPGYDHSYFFIASFIGEHMAFHARHLA